MCIYSVRIWLGCLIMLPVLIFVLRGRALVYLKSAPLKSHVRLSSLSFFLSLPRAILCVLHKMALPFLSLICRLGTGQRTGMDKKVYLLPRLVFFFIKDWPGQSVQPLLPCHVMVAIFCAYDYCKVATCLQLCWHYAYRWFTQNSSLPS